MITSTEIDWATAAAFVSLVILALWALPRLLRRLDHEPVQPFASGIAVPEPPQPEPAHDRHTNPYTIYDNGTDWWDYRDLAPILALENREAEIAALAELLDRQAAERAAQAEAEAPELPQAAAA